MELLSLVAISFAVLALAGAVISIFLAFLGGVIFGNVDDIDEKF
jgi:hypothetical protein